MYYLRIVLATLLLGGCASVKEFKHESREWRREVSELRKSLERTSKDIVEQADKAVLAIPGERYSRLVDDLHGDDPERKSRAQNFLKSLAGISLEDASSYQASVWFAFDPQEGPLRADVFRAASASPVHLMARFQSAALNVSNDVRNSELRPLSRDEIDRLLGARLRTLFDTIYTFAEPSQMQLPGMWLAPQLGLKQVRGTFRNRRDMEGALDAERTRMINAYKQLFWTIHDTDGPRAIGRELAVPWNALDSNQWLFVVLLDEDWKRLGGEIQVRALLHRTGNPVERRELLYTFAQDEWNSIELVDDTGLRPPRKVRWAVHNMTNARLVPQTIVDARRAAEEWEKLHRAATKQTDQHQE